jgi:hypothetical protein
MPEYRAYLIGLDGHFINAVEFDCRDDISTAAEAQQRQRPRRGALEP